MPRPCPAIPSGARRSPGCRRQRREWGRGWIAEELAVVLYDVGGVGVGGRVAVPLWLGTNGIWEEEAEPRISLWRGADPPHLTAPLTTTTTTTTAHRAHRSSHSPPHHLLLPYTTAAMRPTSALFNNPAANPARWLSSTRTRLGALYFHGTLPSESTAISQLCTRLTTSWRSLIVPGGLQPGLLKHRVQWGDMDVMGHVNNVVYVRWAESGRINWVRSLGAGRPAGEKKGWEEMWTSRGTGLILRGIGVEFKFPVEFPDRVSVFHKLGKVGEDSFTLDVTILSEKHQRVAARCVEDIVVYNYKPSSPAEKPGKTRIPPFMRAVFDEVLDAQREAELAAADEVREIEEEVQVLERTVLGRKEMK
ncbi:thioesterase-like superfamily-domain-containing protein [Geopyxis carbonaria]|nr:thioesterase-like superfamily-domain-containing protein [Geopyxis carbonaria]